jgi:hypothetical protein
VRSAEPTRTRASVWLNAFRVLFEKVNPMIAILTKFLGPTNSRGARVKAYRGDDPTVSCTVPFEYADSTEQAHRNAALQLCARFDWLQDGTVLVAGGTRQGYAFVFINASLLAGPR